MSIVIKAMCKNLKVIKLSGWLVCWLGICSAPRSVVQFLNRKLSHHCEQAHCRNLERGRKKKKLSLLKG